MNQMILKTSKYVTMDKKIPTMKSVLITDGIITASADDFILKELVPEAEFLDLQGKTLVPGFVDAYGDFLKRAEQLGGIRAACEAYLAQGVTTVAQKNATTEMIETLRAADQNGELLLDVAVYMTEEAASVLPEQMPMDNGYEGHIRYAGVSVYADEMIAEDMLTQCFARHIEKHQQVAVTAYSSTVIMKVMNAYKAALMQVNGTKVDEDGQEKPKIYEDLRPLLCGCKTLSGEQLTQLQALGFVPCFPHDLLLEEERLSDRDYPIRDIVRRGMAFCLTHDGTKGISPVDTIHVACNRADASGVVGTDQTINADQAVLAQSLFASYALFEDLTKGSLTMTKKADLVVLDQNPLETSDSMLQDMKVCMTIKNGQVAWTRG